MKSSILRGTPRAMGEGQNSTMGRVILPRHGPPPGGELLSNANLGKGRHCCTTVIVGGVGALGRGRQRGGTVENPRESPPFGRGESRNLGYVSSPSRSRPDPQPVRPERAPAPVEAPGPAGLPTREPRPPRDRSPTSRSPPRPWPGAAASPRCTCSPCPPPPRRVTGSPSAGGAHGFLARAPPPPGESLPRSLRWPS